MSITATNKGSGGFELPPEGNHPARCVSIIDLGTTESEYKGEVSLRRQVWLAFELPTKLKTYEYEGETITGPYLASDFYTLSLNEKANLCKLLEGWRGRGFTEEEKEGFDITVLAGVPCLLNIVPYVSEQGNKKVRLSASRLPDGMTCPDPVNEITVFSLEDYNKDVFNGLSDGLQRLVMKSDEYKVISGEVAQRPARVVQEAPPEAGEFDDIPF